MDEREKQVPTETIPIAVVKGAPSDALAVPVFRALGYILPALITVLIGYQIYSWAQQLVSKVKPFLGLWVNSLPYGPLVNFVLLVLMGGVVIGALWIFGVLLANRLIGSLLYGLRNALKYVPVINFIYGFIGKAINDVIEQLPEVKKQGEPAILQVGMGIEVFGMVTRRFTTETGEERCIFYAAKSPNPLDGWTLSVPACRVRRVESLSVDNLFQTTGTLGVVAGENIMKLLRTSPKTPECEVLETDRPE